MPVLFSNSDLINLAVGIEKTGYAFYQALAKGSETKERALFERLAGMEQEHIKIFQSLLTKTGGESESEDQSEEYSGYINALVDNAVFTQDKISREIEAKANNQFAALDLAINAEKDSILFYIAIKPAMPSQTHSVIEQIIDEEKAHLMQLSEVKRKG